MALARIISHSQLCSRELALDLLARGYAVEIVSPDKIPDNIADLELRVEEDLGNQLIANVAAHDGARSASLEFLHHLKAPMVDFVRRPPELDEAFHVPEKLVSFNAAPSIEEVKLPAKAPQLAPKIVSSAVEIPLDPELDPEPDPELKPALDSAPDYKEDASLLSPPHPLPSPPPEPPTHFAVEASTAAAQPAIVRSAQKPQRPDRPAEWVWRPALTFACVVLLAVVLVFGMWRKGKASVQSSEAASAEKVAPASADMNLLSPPTPQKDTEEASGQVSALAVSPSATKSDANSNHAPKPSPAGKAVTGAAGTSAAGTRTSVSSRHRDDLVARDTVTYLDERYRPKAIAGRHPNSRKHGGVIAANTVTYLDKKPTPKTAKQNASTKPHPNPN
jgi:hypothetical protein